MYLLKTRLSLFRFFPGASALPLILVSVICFYIICIAGHKSISQTFFLIPAVCIFLFGCTVTAEFPQSYIEFGLWPQSLKAENVKITEEQKKINGFSAFKGSDTEKALLFSEKIITGGIKFYKLKDSERYYIPGTGYLYKAREINGNKIHPNNYEFSEVRAFLNGLNGESYGVSDFLKKDFLTLHFQKKKKNLFLLQKLIIQ